ncbi:hypothetical protein K501DRAFT_333340 [Backusella circina FSU 941]|nr:hypothetical protein K501DRAFT_333340 [Backusella circina FSU 941]
MDILTTYLTETSKTKIVISFFKKERAKVEQYCNNLEPDNKQLDLKLFWAGEIDKFAKANPHIQVIKDYYLIDFVDLEIFRKNHNLNQKIKYDILETRRAAATQLAANTDTEENMIEPLSSTEVYTQLETRRKKLAYCEEYHKKDLLYHHIVDLATTNTSHAIYEVLSKKQRKKYISDYKSRMNIATEVSSVTKDVLKHAKNKTLKDTVKDAKAKLGSADGKSKKITKKVIKVCKIYRDMMEADNENKFVGHLNENEFTHQYLYPMFKQVLHDCPLKFRLGESHLQCAAAETNDDQRTQCGPKIDIIILHKVHQFAISVCEVSGPHFKTNKNHSLGDRNKLAKNMRAILNHIEQVPSTPNATAFRKIKIYGFQVYLNKLYIYSMTSLGNGYNVFVLENTLPIPVSLTLLEAQLPAFLGWIWNMNAVFKQTIIQIDSFIEISKEEEPLEVDSQPSSTNSSQESNTTKRQRTN